VFGTTERTDRSQARAVAASDRLGGWLAARPGLRGLVLTGPAAVAWATGGIAPPVDRTAAVDLTWVVRTPSGAALITTEVEADRLRAEYGPASHGFSELIAVPWYEPESFVTAVQSLAGAAAGDLAADGHPAFGTDAGDDLIALRLALSPAERDDLRDLGADAAAALETALAGWQPGERDLDVQARCAAFLEARGADAPVLIVGGDERVERFRHPMAAGVPMRRLVMAVVVARRGGLHAAATRFACAGPVDDDYAALRDRVLAIEAQVLTASVPPASPPPAGSLPASPPPAGSLPTSSSLAGSLPTSSSPGDSPPPSYGDALAALARGYDQAGAPDGWKGHYQGGPIGYGQREFEIAPRQPSRGHQDPALTESRWLAEPIRPGHALAWNPSLPGGAKAEDTYLVTGDGTANGTGGGLERVTVSGPDWPTLPADGLIPPRPAILQVSGLTRRLRRLGSPRETL
jgi:Xaa-Pro dipeptidase